MRIRVLVFSLLLISCHYNQKILEGKDLDPNKKYLLMIAHEPGNVQIVTDNAAILRHVKDMEIETSESCGGTTPDYVIALYQDGEWMESWNYCSFEWGSDMDIGKLKKYIHSGKKVDENGLNMAKYHERLVELRQKANIYLTTYRYHDSKEEGEIHYFMW